MPEPPAAATASAPGKLHLAGEYAVLDGADAIVAAVDRRAVAAPGAREPSAFLDALAAVLRDGGEPAAAARVDAVAVDTSALRRDAVKLGLGSSAAATVAACAYALGPGAARDRIHAFARAAHARAQGDRGARGSGADIAAAVHGGVIAVTPPRATEAIPRVRAIALPPLELVAFWTGRPADTVPLVAAITAAAAARAEVRAAITAIADAAAGLAAAATPAAAIDAITAGGDAITRLAAVSGVELEPPVIAAARAIARAAGGAAKTTGAGGGDVAILVAPPGTDATALRAALAAAGALPVDLRIDPRGVDIQAPEV
jgi:phosphomevalonate kinase